MLSDSWILLDNRHNKPVFMAVSDRDDDELVSSSVNHRNKKGSEDWCGQDGTRAMTVDIQ